MLAVAVSGGRDSTALLHAVVRAARAARAPGLRVVALHVHHGLQAEADTWRRHVQRQCQRWGCGFDWRRLEGRPAAGESLEAWARQGRYAALTEMAHAHGAREVWLAHHRRDQAETVLLQALRGAGPAGLAAMPRTTLRDGIRWVRPWLQQGAEAVAAYAARWRLAWVEDPSNADARLARNALRLQVWPALAGAFPYAEVAFAQAAAQAAQAAALASEVGAVDLAAVAAADGLHLAAWSALPPARRANALHGWLAEHATAALVARLLGELPTARSGAVWPLGGGARLGLYRGVLAVQPPPALAGVSEPGMPNMRHASAASNEQVGAPCTLLVREPGAFPLPDWGGTLVVAEAAQGGATPARLASLQLRARAGGERLARAPGAAPRSLKKQYQAAAVPEWARGGPLVFDTSGALLFAPGLGMDARAWAAPGQPQWALRWHRTEPAACCGAP